MTRLKLALLIGCIGLTSTTTQPLTIFDALWERNVIIQEQISKLNSANGDEKGKKSTQADESNVKQLQEEYDKNKLLLDAVMGNLDKTFDINLSGNLTRIAMHFMHISNTWKGSPDCEAATASCLAKMKTKTMKKVEFNDGYYVPLRNLADAIAVLQNENSSEHDLKVAQLLIRMTPKIPAKF